MKCRVGYHQRVGKSSVLRIYESSPRYTFSVATLSHTGFRTYLLLNYRPIQELLLSLKVGKTLYTKAELARLPRAEIAYINGFDILFSLHILSVTR